MSRRLVANAGEGTDLFVVGRHVSIRAGRGLDMVAPVDRRLARSAFRAGLHRWAPRRLWQGTLPPAGQRRAPRDALSRGLAAGSFRATHAHVAAARAGRAQLSRGTPEHGERTRVSLRWPARRSSATRARA